MRKKNYPYYDHPEIATLRKLLDYCAEAHGDNIAFQYQKKKELRQISFVQFRANVNALGTYLFEQGFHGAHIALIGENSYEWILTHFSVTCGGNVIVPIDKDLPVDEIAMLLKKSDCTALFFSPTYADIAEELMQKGFESLTLFNLKDIPRMIQEGNVFIQNGNKEFATYQVNKTDLASIVFTSGTTGTPKGVMLTHGNFCSCMCGAARNVSVSGASILLLPLHHAFGLVAAVFAEMIYGYPIYINSSMKRLADDFQKGKPQNFFAVPLIVESLYNNIWRTAKKQGNDGKLRRMIKISDLLLKCKIDVRRMLFKSIISSFGGNLELIISGGAALDEKYVHAFRSFGITVLNGYGITECGPIVAVNRNEFFIPDSVGLPLSCNEVRIASDGEILVKGENVTAGYYHSESDNAEAFSDGWFHTDDLGHFDEYGMLHITGRKKNLIILANGENISAELIEQKLYAIPYLKEVIVYGVDHLIAAEVYLDESVSDARERIDEDIKMINQQLPQNQNIGKIIVRDTEFPKTTTQKIIRNGEK